MYSIDLILDSDINGYSNTILSDIDKLDFVCLQFEILNPPISLNKENFLEAKDDITLIALVQL